MKSLKKEYLKEVRKVRQLRKLLSRHPQDEKARAAIRMHEKALFELAVQQSKDLEDFIFYTDHYPATRIRFSSRQKTGKN